MELEALQEIKPEIEGTSASLLALSPSRPEFSRRMAEKLGLTFPILSDIDNLVAKQLNIVFTVPEELQTVYLSFGIDLERFNGNPHWELPLPATYIINTDGAIAYAELDADHTYRLEPEELLRQLGQL